MKRPNRTVFPGGTITFSVLHVRSQVVETYVGTDDARATPTGGGLDPNYNMVTGHVILEETGTTYDDAGNAIQTTHRQRYHDAPANQTGPLGSPSVTPKARITYSAAYPDALGRTMTLADYGTHGGSAFTRPANSTWRCSSIEG